MDKPKGFFSELYSGFIKTVMFFLFLGGLIVLLVLRPLETWEKLQDLQDSNDQKDQTIAEQRQELGQVYAALDEYAEKEEQLIRERDLIQQAKKETEQHLAKSKQFVKQQGRTIQKNERKISRLQRDTSQLKGQLVKSRDSTQMWVYTYEKTEKKNQQLQVDFVLLESNTEDWLKKERIEKDSFKTALVNSIDSLALTRKVLVSHQAAVIAQRQQVQPEQVLIGFMIGVLLTLLILKTDRNKAKKRRLTQYPTNRKAA